MAEFSAFSSIGSGPRVLCVGETMALVTTDGNRDFSTSGPGLELGIGGAESNVAIALAQLGIAAAWWSRLGSDPLGQMLARTISSYGVGIDELVYDRDRPTAVYFKDSVEGRSRVHYYRRGSAAASMSPDDLAKIPTEWDLLHVSGITAALSQTADALLEKLLALPRESGRRVSFDVNYRPSLWSPAQAGGRLRQLAEMADIVFVGLDEAEQLWGSRSPEHVRGMLSEVPHLVVKDSGNRVTVFSNGDEPLEVFAPRVDVIDVVGAGDAFAAGYLAADLNGYSSRTAAMFGHIVARAALQVRGDIPVLPRLGELAAEVRRQWTDGFDEKG